MDQKRPLEKKNFKSEASNKVIEDGKKIVTSLIQKLDSKMIPFIVASVVIIMILILGIFVIKGEKKLDKPILFVENEQLILWNKKNHVVVDESYSTSNNSHLIAAFMNHSNDLIAYVNGDSLYLFNRKKNEKEKVASNVSDSICFSKDDQYIIYQDKEGSIYYYDIKKNDKSKIVSVQNGEKTEIVSVVEGGIFYKVKNDETDTLYLYSFGNVSENHKIATGVSEYILSKDQTRVLYFSIKENGEGSYHIYDFKKKKMENIIDKKAKIISYNDDLTKIVYMKESEESGILEDDEKGNDPTITEQKLCTYSAHKNGNCSRSDWLYDRYYTTRISKRTINDAIREKAITYDIYFYEKGKMHKLVSNVTDVLAASAENGLVWYEKAKVDEKVKISSLKSVEDFEKYLEQLDYETFYQSGTGSVVSLNVDAKQISKALITENGSGYLVDKDNDLFYINLKKKHKKFELVDSVVSEIVLTDVGLMYYTNVNKESNTTSIKVASEKKSKEIASNVSKVESSENKIGLYHDCSKDACHYSIYDKTVKEIAKEVYSVIEIDSNHYYELKHYSSKNKTVDLYILENGKSNKIAHDLKEEYIEYRDKEA